MARSSATTTVPIAIIIIVFCLFLACGFIHARNSTTYIVGDRYGWDLVVGGDEWARGKTFYAGDILVFRYNDDDTNLYVVNRTGYETCIPNDGAIEYDSGDDKIQLVYGWNYFIGAYDPVDCSAGMKMAINALAAKNQSSKSSSLSLYKASFTV